MRLACAVTLLHKSSKFSLFIALNQNFFLLISGEGGLSFWLLHLDSGAFCVGSVEHILVLEDCKGHG